MIERLGISLDNAEELKFLTKTGYCHVTYERLVIKREGVIGKASQGIYGSSIKRTLLIYTILTIIILALGVQSVYAKNYFTEIFLLLNVLLFIINIILSRNNSATNMIERPSVELVEAHPPHHPFTKAYFTIHFVEKGKKYKRLIMLPGSLSGGNEEYKKALAIMKQKGWYNS
jgi:hypothetical protein